MGEDSGRSGGLLSFNIMFLNLCRVKHTLIPGVPKKTIQV